jgi:hypothetical protein
LASSQIRIDAVPSTRNGLSRSRQSSKITTDLGGIADMAGLTDSSTRSLMTQAVWKRISYPNNCKRPGVMDLDATG